MARKQKEFKGVPADTESQQVTIEEYTEQALRDYGSYVVEDRAVPDYRDGLKPVHRAIMWSLAGLGLRPDKGYKKSARTVGDVIGKYHPHGDMAAYGAMVTIANTLPPIVDGQGNWGTPVNMAASQRYTEARMSKFAHRFLLDPKYLEVVPYVANFSGDDKIPLYMPALLPYLMFNGSVPAPAYGVRAGNPSFTFSSVAKVITLMLKGRKISGKVLAKHLELCHSYGCENITKDDDFLTLMETGKSSIYYAPLRHYDYTQRVIHLRSFVPAGLASAPAIDRVLNKISVIPGVKRCFSRQGKKSKGSGPYGALLVIECAKNISEDAFLDIVDAIEKQTTCSVSYRLGVTVRTQDKGNKFLYLSYVRYLQTWIKYRIALETRLVKFLLSKVERDLHINRVYLFAVENMPKLLKVLPKVLMSKTPDKALAKALGIPEEDAKIILDRKVRQLARLEAADLKDKIKALEAEQKQLRKDLKAPGERAARDTQERVKAYLKNPDVMKSGLALT